MKTRSLLNVMVMLLLSWTAYGQNLAFMKPAKALSEQAVGTPAFAVNDGSATSRWASAQGIDPQWVSIDLGATYDIRRVKITWEAAYGKDFKIQTSPDENQWSDIKSITGNTALFNDITGLTGRGRYIRILGTARGTVWGYSIYELEVYNTDSGGNAAPVANAGADKTITLPVNHIVLNGSGSDADGTVAAYAWTQVSGPSTAALAGATTATLTATNLIAGTYVFRLTVTDNGGQTGSDTVTVTVSPGTTSSNLAWNKGVVATSIENGATLPEYAVDGDPVTRWSSQAADPTSITVDLGAVYTFSRVRIVWETALGKDYLIQTAAASGGPWETVRNVAGNTDLINDHMGLTASGRYVRIYGIARGTGYGYSIYELEVYALSPNNPVTVPLHIPYVQYLDLGFTPSDLSGVSQLITQNNPREATLLYHSGTIITVKPNDYRGEDQLQLWTVNQRNDTIRVVNGPLAAMVYPGMQIGVRLVKVNNPGGGNRPEADAGYTQRITLPVACASLNGSGSTSPNGAIASYAWSQVSGPSTATLTNATSAVVTACGLVAGTYTFRLLITDHTQATATDDVQIIVRPAETFDFSLTAPADRAMITTTRRPTFTWQAVSGATRYDVYVNTSRTDYDWYASGNFLDRYTRVAQTTTTSLVMPTPLTDRWTYKWYVVATTPQGEKRSNTRYFSVYLPQLEQAPDGINVVNGARDANKNGTIEPYEDWRLTIDQRLNDLMGRLTLEEKYKQCFYSDQQPLDGFSFSYGVEDGMRTLQYRASATRLGIPIAFAGDKIHGWKTIFPTQLGMAATRDMNLVYQVGNLQRVEHKSKGFTGTLAPLAEVNTKVLYPRFQEGAGENADEAAALARALVVGMQGGPEINPHSMLITVKHWPGQGAGGENALQYDAVTIKYHMKPWHAIVEANAASVMPGYNTAPFLDPSGKGANSSKRIIKYLRNEINFQGFVVTDWLAANTAQSVESMGAGIDVLGGAPSELTDVNQLVAAIGLPRLDAAVRRVLDMKFRLGLFENPYGDSTATWTNAKHHAIALNAARKSITLLKNNGVLPLQVRAGENIIVGGPHATWVNNDVDPNVIWQSIYYDNPLAKNYYKAFQDRAAGTGANVVLNNASAGKVAVVVIGEGNYTHGTVWEDKNPVVPEEQLAVIRGFRNRGIPVVAVVISPRPYVLTDVLQLSDAVMMVYRGGNGIGQATAELCFGDYNPSGKLPFQLPRATTQIGTDNINDQRERWELPYDLGATDAERAQIRSIIDSGAPVPTTYGNPLLPYGYGLQNFSAAGLATQEAAVVAGQEERQASLSDLRVYPNSAVDEVTIQFGVEIPGTVNLVIVQALGAKQTVLKGEPKAKGVYTTRVDVRSLPKGVHIIRLESADGVRTCKLLKQ
ncbi:discoidin domain-containing protein [Fulvivirgaceae bacterium PWU5]|uniref:beta-glucosidase n=1 Tax=Dawidia cretensis TaxID=2782350 RepID=A0AAP2E4D0_9BACT|nr:discoidin domain-containing protein [Dawidia cretensis]MBT1711352.1 discoidin domain-containing protein [Dawidia cretensis]